MKGEAFPDCVLLGPFFSLFALVVEVKVMAMAMVRTEVWMVDSLMMMTSYDWAASHYRSPLWNHQRRYHHSLLSIDPWGLVDLQC